MKPIHLALTLVLSACAAAEKGVSVMSPASATVVQPSVRSGHVEVNGVSYYYEVHGKGGQPVLLLHGGLGSIGMFEPLLPELSANRTVIAVDLQGHGRSSLGDRPISLVDMGNDMAAIVKTAGFESTSVDVVGYSLGGGVAFQFAAQHPKMVRKLVMISAGYSQAGFHPEMLPLQAQVGAAMAPMMKDTPMYQSYAAVAPHPEDFPKLLDRMGECMRKSYDWSDDVKKLTMPTMLVVGDADMFRLEHIVDFYHRLGGALRDAGWQREHMSQNRLAILPNVTHYEMAQTPQLASTVLPFLDRQ